MGANSSVVDDPVVSSELEKREEKVAFNESLGEERFVQVCKVLAKGQCSWVKEASFKHLMLISHGPEALVRMLEQNTTLRALTLDDSTALAPVLQGMARNKGLVSLCIIESRLSRADFEALASALQKKENRTLKQLSIHCTPSSSVSDDIAAHIVEGAVEGGTLEKLGLTMVSLTAVGAYNICKILLEKNRTLKSLDVSCNNLGTDAGRIFADFLTADTVLEELNIALCGLKQKGFREIVVAVTKSNRTLKSLNLSGNRCDDLSCIAELLRANARLKTLVLEKCGTAGPDVEDIAQTLERGGNCTLTRLSLSETFITDAAVAALAKMLRTNTSLLALELRMTNIYQTDVLKIIDSLSVNSTLEKILLPRIEDQPVLDRLKEVLKHNGALTNCDGYFGKYTLRNQRARRHCKEAVLTLLLIRRFRQGHALSALPKELVQLIARQLWASRLNPKAWV